jgi:hypothetical protein
LGPTIRLLLKGLSLELTISGSTWNRNLLFKFLTSPQTILPRWIRIRLTFKPYKMCFIGIRDHFCLDTRFRNLSSSGSFSQVITVGSLEIRLSGAVGIRSFQQRVADEILVFYSLGYL